MLFINKGFSQKIDWVIEPKIDNVDKIFLENGCKDLVKVKKGKKYGVVNSSNELIIPIDYGKLGVHYDFRIFAYDKYVQNAYDAEGYKLDFDTAVEELNSYRKKKKEEGKPDNKLQELNEENTNFIIEKIFKEAKVNGYTLLSLKGDTIVRNFYKLNKVKFYNNEYAVINSDTTSIYNKEGKRIIHYGGRYAEVRNRGDHFIIKNKRMYTLFHKEKKINEDPIEGLSFVKGYPYLIMKQEGKSYLTDDSFKKIEPTPANYIGRVEEADLLYYKMDEGAVIWDLKSQKKITHDFKLFREIKKSTNYIVKQDTAFGVYDFVKDEIIIPIKYKRIWKKDQRKILASSPNGDKSKQDVYNYDGTLLWKGRAKKGSIYTLRHDMCVLMQEDGSYDIMDKFGSSIYKTNTAKLSASKGGNWLIITEGKLRKFYPVKNIVNNIAEDRYFHSVIKNYNTDKKFYYNLAVKEGKYGFIDIDGNIVLPLIFDEVDFDGYGDYIKLKYKGKWGAVERPQSLFK